jgi:hypothetical protein
MQFSKRFPYGLRIVPQTAPYTICHPFLHICFDVGCRAVQKAGLVIFQERLKYIGPPMFPIWPRIYFCVSFIASRLVFFSVPKNIFKTVVGPVSASVPIICWNGLCSNTKTTRVNDSIYTGPRDYIAVDKQGLRWGACTFARRGPARSREGDA